MHPQVKPVTIGEHLAKYPATDRIGKLFAGSWICHNFAIWIGHEEDRTAWDLLHQTREFLKKATEEKQASADVSSAPGRRSTSPRGATGSGGSATTTRRRRTPCSTSCSASICRTSTRCWASRRRVRCMRPIKRVAQRIIHSQPKSFLRVKVDGRQSFFEWLNAGDLPGRTGTRHDGPDVGRPRATGAVRVRSRPAAGPHRYVATRRGMTWRASMKSGCGSLSRRTSKSGSRIPRRRRRRSACSGTASGLPGRRRPRRARRSSSAAFRCRSSRSRPGSPCHWSMELFAQKQSREKIPSEGAFELTVPQPDFEQRVWQA